MIFRHQEPGRGEADVHKLEPADRTDRVLHHSLAEVRRCTQRRPHGIPDQPCALSKVTGSCLKMRRFVETVPPTGL